MDQGRAAQGSQSLKVTGPNGSALKYDILTALLVTAAKGEPVEARLALRLSLIITARFNWRRGRFAVGQRELARMWGVTERTAKREMAEMRGRGWIAVAVPSARGRVAEYEIVQGTVLRATLPYWDDVGPDFAARMHGTPEPETGQPSGNVVPLRPVAVQLDAEDETGWSGAAMRLQAQDPALFQAWLASLVPVEIEAGLVTLAAPTRFQADYLRTHFQSRILSALIAENGGIRDVLITGP